MGRHRTAEEKRELGERARALRAAGRSRREIQVELGIGDDLAKAFLAGTEVPAALRRPRAKDDVREQAVLMRQRGRTYDDIALDLGVSKSSLSLWLRGTSSVTCDALEAGRDTDEPPRGLLPALCARAGRS